MAWYMFILHRRGQYAYKRLMKDSSKFLDPLSTPTLLIYLLACHFLLLIA